jgi:hypothetical protein
VRGRIFDEKNYVCMCSMVGCGSWLLVKFGGYLEDMISYSCVFPIMAICSSCYPKSSNGRLHVGSM